MLKAAYCTRRIPKYVMKTLLSGPIRPRAGDLVLAKILAPRRQKHLALANGHKSLLHKDEYVILCYGNRYAPDQFEAYVPDQLEPCQIVSQDGIAAKLHSRQHPPAHLSAEIKPLGLVGDESGRPLNIKDWMTQHNPGTNHSPYTIAVVGSDADSGQTTASAQLMAGLNRAGLQVGAAKVTGTTAPQNNGCQTNPSGHVSQDQPECSAASPSLRKQQQLAVMLDALISELCTRDVEVIVLELSKCLDLQPDSLLASEHFTRHINAIIVTSRNVLQAKAGIDWLMQKKLPVRAVSGVLMASPMLAKQARKMIALPALDGKALSSPDIISLLDDSGLDSAHQG